MDIKKSFQDKFKQVATENQQPVNTFSIDLTNINFEFIKEFEEAEKEILEITKEFYIVAYKGQIELGTVYNKAFEVFTKDGNYEKWLKHIGVDKKTALRHRKRATLYSSCKSDKDKQTIASLSQKFIDKIFEERELLENLSNIKTINFDKENINPKEEQEEIELIDIDLSSEVEDVFSEISEKIDGIEEKDKQKLHKLLSQIKKILN